MSISFNYNKDLTENQKKTKEVLVTEWVSNNPTLVQEYHGPDTYGKSDIEIFINKISELIDEEFNDNEYKVMLMDEYPENNIMENPKKPGEDLSAVVIYSLRERAPGSTSKGNTPMDRSRREVSSRYRGWSKDDINHPGQILLHYGKFFDNLICFEIVAKTSKNANKIADWFEEFMEVNREIFAKNGIVKYHFDKREGDKYLASGETGYHVRPMVYFVRTERTYTVTENTINKLVVKLSKT